MHARVRTSWNISLSSIHFIAVASTTTTTKRRCDSIELLLVQMKWREKSIGEYTYLCPFRRQWKKCEQKKKSKSNARALRWSGKSCCDSSYLLGFSNCHRQNGTRKNEKKQQRHINILKQVLALPRLIVDSSRHEIAMLSTSSSEIKLFVRHKFVSMYRNFHTTRNGLWWQRNYSTVE